MPSAISFMDAELKLSGPQEIGEAIEHATASQPVRVATLNPELLLEAGGNLEFRHSLKMMTHCSIDGSGLFFALKLWRVLAHASWNIERYPGATLVSDLFRRYQNGSKRFFILGGQPDLHDTGLLERQLKTQYPGLQIVGIADAGHIPKNKVTADPLLLKRIQDAHTDILLVGFGAPKQELWMEKAAEAASIPVMIGVGGTFGFYTRKKRAPHFLQAVHLEWLYRSFTEKGHAKRAWRAVAVFSLNALSWMARNYGLKKRGSSSGNR